MLQKYHREILQQALGGKCSPPALGKIMAANLYQDRLSAQLGHDEYHFDNNAFQKSYAYLEGQRSLVISSLRAGDARSAWAAFGRLTHTVQDFYAHTNYIDLWLSSHSNGVCPAPSEVEPVIPELVNSPRLCSGKLYYPLEVFSFTNILKPLILPLLPRDSHAWMNLDSPQQGFKFDYAMHASLKRTMIEFEKTTRDLPQDLLNLFAGR